MYAILLHQTVTHLADGISNNAPASGSTNTFWNTELGGAVGALLSALGVLIVVIAIIRGIADALAGKLGKSFKIILGALILGVFMIQPALIGDLISAVATLVKDVIDSISQLIGNSSNSTSS